MSFIKRRTLKQDYVEEATPVQNNTESNLYMQFDVVPIPKTTDKYDSSQKAQQRANIAMIEARGKDLFTPNNTRVSLNNGKRLYQTEMLYGKFLPIEHLIPMLTNSDLTLKVNAVRTGADSHSTCMELKSGIMADLLEETADAKGDKVTKIELSNEEHGAMFVAVKQLNGFHYIQKVDYEVSKESDDKMHI